MSQRARLFSPLVCMVALLSGCTPDDGDTAGDTGADPTGGAVLVDKGALSVCLGTDDATALEAGWSNRFELVGTVVDHSDLVAPEYALSDDWDCGEASVVLALTDDAGSRWWLGMQLEYSSGDAVDFPIDIATDQAVQVLFGQDSNESGVYFGLVVYGDDGLLLAAEDHRFSADDLPGLAVGQGDDVARETDDCGTREWYTTTFDADDALALTPGEDGALTVGGQVMRVHSANHWRWTEEQCTDLGASRAWVMAR